MNAKTSVAAIIATGLGSGLSPKAPGTAGSLAALLLLWMVDSYFIDVSVPRLAIVLLVVFLIGYWSCAVVEPLWGHDPGKIVVDEFVGVWIPFLFVPLQWESLVLAFGTFRFFDILKPLGVGYLDRHLDGPLSVMLDDVLAGIYAALASYVFLYFMPL